MDQAYPLWMLADDPTKEEIARSLDTWNMHDTTRLMTAVGVLIVGLVILGMILMYLRKRLLANPSKLSGAGSMMEELRAMKARGELSEAEYDAARRAMVARVAGNKGGTGAATGNPPAGGPPGAPARSPTFQAPPGRDLTGRPLPKPRGEP